DDFFELGGHSFLALRLVDRVEKEFGTALSLSAVVEGPTIEQLADILRREALRSPHTRVVPLQPHGARLPLFLLPSLVADHIIFRELARCLGTDRPVYGFESEYKAEPPRFIPFVEMATQYVHDLLRFRPQGPYYLAGYSFGGRLAYEVARQLRVQGNSAV